MALSKLIYIQASSLGHCYFQLKHQGAKERAKCIRDCCSFIGPKFSSQCPYWKAHNQCESGSRRICVSGATGTCIMCSSLHVHIIFNAVNWTQVETLGFFGKSVLLDGVLLGQALEGVSLKRTQVKG